MTQFRVDISAVSTEYVRARISAREAGAIVNPTGGTAEMAFLAEEVIAPQEADWVAAGWETAGTTYYARILVGPLGDITLDPGTYRIWVRLGETPEHPVKSPGLLYVE